MIDEWATDIYPNRTSYGAMTKLVLEEIPELVMSRRKGGKIDEGEIADIIILALDIATLEGYSAAVIVNEKMKKNKQRDWIIDSETGLMSHKE